MARQLPQSELGGLARLADAWRGTTGSDTRSAHAVFLVDASHRPACADLSAAGAGVSTVPTLRSGRGCLFTEIRRAADFADRGRCLCALQAAADRRAGCAVSGGRHRVRRADDTDNDAHESDRSGGNRQCVAGNVTCRSDLLHDGLGSGGMEFHPVQWAEEHPLPAAAIVFGGGLVVLWALGFFTRSGSNDSGTANMAAAYYAAEAQQAVIGGQIQQATLTTAAATKQAEIQAGAATSIAQIQATTDQTIAAGQYATAQQLGLASYAADVTKAAYSADVAKTSYSYGYLTDVT